MVSFETHPIVEVATLTTDPERKTPRSVLQAGQMRERGVYEIQKWQSSQRYPRMCDSEDAKCNENESVSKVIEIRMESWIDFVAVRYAYFPLKK